MLRTGTACRFIGIAVALGFFLVEPPVSADKALPIFDTHVHYSQDAWATYDPEAIIKILDQAGVTRALVSSTPDDGTLMLYRQDPARIVPILRPYRSAADMGSWLQDTAVLAYVQDRLQRSIYRGMGEFHLNHETDVNTSQIKRLVRLAVEHDMVLHVHCGAGPVRALYDIGPELKILWAHAGMDASPAIIKELFDSYSRLWTELSLRASDIAPNGRIDPAWRELFVRYPDRFMIGTDTWTTWRWPQYVEIVQRHRQWLGQLPRDVAEKIAFRNAMYLFGAARRAN